jgi:hypothetical protein
MSPWIKIGERLGFVLELVVLAYASPRAARVSPRMRPGPAAPGVRRRGDEAIIAYGDRVCATSVDPTNGIVTVEWR